MYRRERGRLGFTAPDARTHFVGVGGEGLGGTGEDLYKLDA